MLRLLDKIEAGEANEKDLDILWNVCDSIGGKTLCPFGDAAIAPPQSTLKKFREEYEYHVREKRCWKTVAETFRAGPGDVPASRGKPGDADDGLFTAERRGRRGRRGTIRSSFVLCVLCDLCVSAVNPFARRQVANDERQQEALFIATVKVVVLFTC